MCDWISQCLQSLHTFVQRSGHGTHPSGMCRRASCSVASTAMIRVSLWSSGSPPIILAMAKNAIISVYSPPCTVRSIVRTLMTIGGVDLIPKRAAASKGISCPEPCRSPILAASPWTCHPFSKTRHRYPLARIRLAKSPRLSSTKAVHGPSLGLDNLGFWRSLSPRGRPLCGLVVFLPAARCRSRLLGRSVWDAVGGFFVQRKG